MDAYHYLLHLQKRRPARASGFALGGGIACNAAGGIRPQLHFVLAAAGVFGLATGGGLFSFVSTAPLVNEGGHGGQIALCGRILFVSPSLYLE